jgi:hypothetical protein
MHRDRRIELEQGDEMIGISLISLIAPGHDAQAIMLDFVQPPRSLTRAITRQRAYSAR